LPQKLGSPEKAEIWFYTIRNILEHYPKDILTLHLESYVAAQDIKKLLDQTSLSTYLLTSKKPNDLSLTLGEMRTKNERLIVFSDYAHKRKNTLPITGIWPTTHYIETEYSLTEYKACELRDDFRARIDDQNTNLFVFNHFYKTSYESRGKQYQYDTINSYKEISCRINLCLSEGLYSLTLLQ
jgi:hypothetical protein